MKFFIVLLIISCIAFAQSPFDFLPYVEPPQETGGDVDSNQVLERLWEFEGELGDLNKKIYSISQRQDSLEESIKRFEISGFASGKIAHFELQGEKPRDFLGRELWQDQLEAKGASSGNLANQLTSLTLVGRPAPQIEVRGDLAATTIWGGATVLSADNLAIMTNLDPVRTIAGIYYTSFTPLTLYYPVAEPWFESELFANQRASLFGKQKLKAPKRRLEGVSGEINMDSFAGQGLLARVRTENDSAPYRFLTGVNLNLIPGEQNLVGLNWISLKDDPKSTGANITTSDLLGLNWQWRLWQDLFFTGETVKSSYDYSLTDGLDPIVDLARVLELRWLKDEVILQLRALDIGTYYFAPTSQSRDYRLSQRSIFGPETALTVDGVENENAIDSLFPYGLATPNRLGTQFRGYLSPKKGLRISLELAKVQEKQAASAYGETQVSSHRTKRNFTGLRLGGELDLRELAILEKPLKVLGQIQTESISRADDTATPQNEELQLNSKSIDWGISYQLQPAWSLMYGQKVKFQKGSIPNSLQTTVYGVEIKVSANTYLQLNEEIVQGKNSEGQNYRGRQSQLLVETRF